jgi:hypothetical protein
MGRTANCDCDGSGGCTRAVAKAALESCNHNCKTAVLMVLTGLDAWKAMNCWRRIMDLFGWPCRKRRKLKRETKKPAEAGFSIFGD